MIELFMAVLVWLLAYLWLWNRIAALELGQQDRDAKVEALLRWWQQQQEREENR